MGSVLDLDCVSLSATGKVRLSVFLALGKWVSYVLWLWNSKSGRTQRKP